MIILIVLFVIVLMLDVSTPLGVAGGILYEIPLVYSTQINGRKTIAVCSVAALILTMIVPLFFGSDMNVQELVWETNRVYTIISIMGVWYLLDRLKVAMNSYKESSENLESQRNSITKAQVELEEEVVILGQIISTLQFENEEQSEQLALLQTSEGKLASYVATLK